MKFEKDGKVIEVEHDFLETVYLRYGYKKVEEADLIDEEALRLEAKELGIKSYHNMKIENLIKRIEETK